MREAPVVIIGGGPSGLSTAGALKAAGVEAVILDRDDCIGASWLRRYDRLHLHTVGRLSGLAHYPMPKSYPRYPSRAQYADYLRSYVNHFELAVRLKTDVVSVRRDAETGNEPGFVVETESGAWRCRNVVIATGIFGEPDVPDFPGIDDFKGTYLHASSYMRARDYTGQRVLVVGLGNTGAEIAADLVEQSAASVAVSVRTMPTIVPRELFGLPIQATGIILSLLPPALADGIGRFVARFTIGDLSGYGIGPPQWTPFVYNRPPVIDVGFLKQLRARRITVRPDIERFVEHGIVYSDGQEDAIDAVIFATGFKTGLKRLLPSPELIDESGYPRIASDGSTPQHGLYFVGFRQSNRGLLYEMEIDSRRIAAMIAGANLPLSSVRVSGTRG